MLTIKIVYIILIRTCPGIKKNDINKLYKSIQKYQALNCLKAWKYHVMFILLLDIQIQQMLYYVVLQCFSLWLKRIKDICVKISVNESMKCQKLEEFVKVDVKQIGRRNMRS